MDIDSYVFTGDELIDRLDGLIAAQNEARFQIALNQEKSLNGKNLGETNRVTGLENPRLNHSVEILRNTHRELDNLFDQEYTKFPIEIVEEDSQGRLESFIAVIEADADSYGEMVEALTEINGDLTKGDPHMDYSDVPSPIACVDYSETLINEYKRLENTYDFLSQGGSQILDE